VKQRKGMEKRGNNVICLSCLCILNRYLFHSLFRTIGVLFLKRLVVFVLCRGINIIGIEIGVCSLLLMMNEQSKPGNPSAPVILPAKRRRGRPRKDGGVPKRGSSLTPATSAPEMVKKTQAVEANQMDGTVENMVGRMVSGVIDGCFDAGYFLTVRVGNSNTLLRGVIFQPGRFAPISASNDVAPQAKMYQRRDIPVPVPNLQGQNDGMIPQSDKLVKQPVQLGPQPAIQPRKSNHIWIICY